MLAKLWKKFLNNLMETMVIIAVICILLAIAIPFCTHARCNDCPPPDVLSQLEAMNLVQDISD